ncbi:MAG: integrase arm-type DNA-binding domain-containing protein, partial [Brevundimonas sp.]|nr:integrase arm-type DNA-binding domain-containing protein [Brevundimonas sp.]
MTDKIVASLTAPKGSRLEVFDENPMGAGLLLRVSDTGRKAWTLRYRNEDGDQRRLALGLYPDVGLAEARRRCAAARFKANDGADPAGEKRRRKEDRRQATIRTFDELSVVYFAAADSGEWKPRGKRKRASTIAVEKWLWAKHIQPVFGAEKLQDITPAAIKAHLRAFIRKGQDTTSNRVRAQIRQMFNYAIQEAEVMTVNPIAKVKAQGEETPRDRVLRDEEIVALWEALESPNDLVSDKNPRRENQRVYVSRPVCLALKLLLLTMQRRHEVAEMRRSDLDLEQAIWSIPGSETKNSRKTLVPLAPGAIALIREAISLADAECADDAPPSPFVFPARWSKNGSMTPAALTRALRDIRFALDLPRATPHDLRRT